MAPAVSIALIAIVAMPAPPPPPAVSWPVFEPFEVRTPAGAARGVIGWSDAAGRHWREVDQSTHPIHLGSPPEAWGTYGGRCYPDLCKPMPPGAMPGDRPSPTFLGPPE